MEIRPFQIRDEELVIQLWIDCGLVVPWNDPHRDIQRKLRVQPEMFLAVHPHHQRTGVASQLMDEAEALLRAAGCPKINLQVRSTNAEVIEFYRKMGFKVDDVVSLSKRLEASARALTIRIAPIQLSRISKGGQHG